jgi:hypothetical protein
MLFGSQGLGLLDEAALPVGPPGGQTSPDSFVERLLEWDSTVLHDFFQDASHVGI